ncbi:putative MFS family arabinose efflux permease [Ancylobacter aquaticus]|uniref:Putative MFS family arabinose efflux permease n=1 Tax=Ancylobacter aquaticus TaxID=100 RepID=A0A4V2PGF2_ANCAQ|nr:MFS transporter [Ancylobacter aquaticus]TCK16646.1 putative MFS family arabinose efflux permease [Ancylobacter aquaticus]
MRSSPSTVAWLSPLAALAALNLFLADVRDGLGPFLGVFLQEKGWGPAEIGLVMTLGGLVGMAATMPMGALVDASRAKRAIIVIGSAAILAASLTILAIPHFATVALAQAVNGVAAAALLPAIAGLTLGLVGPGGFDHQLGRNEAFNHAGNILAAVLAGVLGWWFGLPAVFALLGAMALLGALSVLAIPADAIDHEAARGAVASPAGEGKARESIGRLLREPALVTAAITFGLFHLGNAAMLPLFGQAMVATAGADPSALTATTVVVAQGTMIPMALVAAWLGARRGYRLVLLLALAALPIRGVVAAAAVHYGAFWALIPVQMLDGVGAGLLGVATPGLVARILAGSGRFNLGLGFAMTAQGIGASLSTLLGGMVAQQLGYSSAFLVLGAVALLAAGAYVIGGCPGGTEPGRPGTAPDVKPAAA